MQVLGIDVGGSGIKGAVVDVSNGQLVTAWRCLDTPDPAEPEVLLETVKTLVNSFGWQGMIGCGFPAVIDGGHARTAANIASDWIDFDVVAALERVTSCRCAVINDADAAGLAEMRYGAGRGKSGSILVLTLGTGIGSALFYAGQLFPNLELGALPYQGEAIERYASAAVRTEQRLDWEQWSQRLNQFLEYIERIFTPELIIVGGGVSREHEHFFPLLNTRAQLTPAQFLNQSGIIGAAHYAADKFKSQG